MVKYIRSPFGGVVDGKINSRLLPIEKSDIKNLHLIIKNKDRATRGRLHELEEYANLTDKNFEQIANLIKAITDEIGLNIEFIGAQEPTVKVSKKKK